MRIGGRGQAPPLRRRTDADAGRDDAERCSALRARTRRGRGTAGDQRSPLRHGTKRVRGKDGGGGRTWTRDETTPSDARRYGRGRGAGVGRRATKGRPYGTGRNACAGRTAAGDGRGRGTDHGPPRASAPTGAGRDAGVGRRATKGRPYGTGRNACAGRTAAGDGRGRGTDHGPPRASAPTGERRTSARNGGRPQGPPLRRGRGVGAPLPPSQREVSSGVSRKPDDGGSLRAAEGVGPYGRETDVGAEWRATKGRPYGEDKTWVRDRDLIRHPPRVRSADATCQPCGTRKNLRACADPRFFRPLR